MMLRIVPAATVRLTINVRTTKYFGIALFNPTQKIRFHSG